MAEWSNEKILNFINEIHVLPELWYVEASVYKDRNLKKDAWAVIAAKFNVTTEEAYKKFRNLRTYAKTELKKKKSGSGAGKKVTWFAFEAISFVLSRDIPDAGTDSETNTMETTVSLFLHSLSLLDCIYLSRYNESNLVTESYQPT